MLLRTALTIRKAANAGEEGDRFLFETPSPSAIFCGGYTIVIKPSPEIKHRGVIFPGQDDKLGERDVALIEGSFGARKSAAELGKLLYQHLNPQLTDEGLRHLVEFLRTGSRPF